MRILTRYVLAEFLKVFLTTLAGTTVLMMVAVVLQEAKRQGIGLSQTIQIIPYLLPNALRFSVPATTLFAACSVFGRLSAMNEVVAVKSSGISPMVLLWPVFVVSILLSMVSVWMNDAAVTWGRIGMQRVIIESVEQIAYSMLRTQKSYATRDMAMNVRTVEGRRLVKPTFTFQQGGDGDTITITADEAELSSDLAKGTLTIRFYNAIIDVGNSGGGITWPGTYEHVVDFNDFSKRGEESGGPSNTAMGQLPTEIAKQEQEIVRLEKEAAAMTALALMTGRFEAVSHPAWKTRSDADIAAARTQLHRYETESPRRWANGASCFCFAFIGAPMAIYRRRGEFLTSFFVVFLPILVGYYPFLLTSVSRAKSGEWMPASVWLGNIVLILAGWWILRKVIRY
jgi:lipopolysaccharide export system permease protein